MLFIVTKNCKQNNMNNNSALNIKESTMLSFVNTTKEARKDKMTCVNVREPIRLRKQKPRLHDEYEELEKYILVIPVLVTLTQSCPWPKVIFFCLDCESERLSFLLNDRSKKSQLWDTVKMFDTKVSSLILCWNVWYNSVNTAEENDPFSVLSSKEITFHHQPLSEVNFKNGPVIPDKRSGS